MMIGKNPLWVRSNTATACNDVGGLCRVDGGTKETDIEEFNTRCKGVRSSRFALSVVAEGRVRDADRSP